VDLLGFIAFSPTALKCLEFNRSFKNKPGGQPLFGVWHPCVRWCGDDEQALTPLVISVAEYILQIISLTEFNLWSYVSISVTVNKSTNIKTLLL